MQMKLDTKAFPALSSNCARIQRIIMATIAVSQTECSVSVAYAIIEFVSVSVCVTRMNVLIANAHMVEPHRRLHRNRIASVILLSLALSSSSVVPVSVVSFAGGEPSSVNMIAHDIHMLSSAMQPSWMYSD